MGELLPVAASAVKGLMPAKIAPFLLNIDAVNKYIEIELSTVYNAEVYNITITAGHLVPADFQLFII